MKKKAGNVIAGFFFVFGYRQYLPVKKNAAATRQHNCPPDAFFMLQLSAY